MDTTRSITGRIKKEITGTSIWTNIRANNRQFLEEYGEKSESEYQDK
jgi:hypothetical protein